MADGDSFEEQLKRDALAKAVEPLAVAPAPEPFVRVEQEPATRQNIHINLRGTPEQEAKAARQLERLKGAFAGVGRTATQVAERTGYEGGRVVKGLATRAGRYTAKQVNAKLEPVKQAHEYAVNPDYQPKTTPKATKPAPSFKLGGAANANAFKLNPSLSNFTLGTRRIKPTKTRASSGVALKINPAFTNYNFGKRSTAKGKPLFGSSNWSFGKRKTKLGTQATQFKAPKWTVFGGRRK